MDGTDPTSSSYSMPYIYNHFTWDHCEEDFQGTIDTMYQQNQLEATEAAAAAAATSADVTPIRRLQQR